MGFAGLKEDLLLLLAGFFPITSDAAHAHLHVCTRAHGSDGLSKTDDNKIAKFEQHSSLEHAFPYGSDIGS